MQLDGALHYLRKLPELDGLRGSAAIGRSHRGMQVQHLRSVYAINQRLLKGWGQAFVYETKKSKASFSFPNEESVLEDALKRMDYDTGKSH